MLLRNSEDGKNGRKDSRSGRGHDLQARGETNSSAKRDVIGGRAQVEQHTQDCFAGRQSVDCAN